MPRPGPLSILVLLLAVALALPACGGARDEDEGEDFPETCNPPFTDGGLTGTWVFEETLEGASCGTTGLNRGSFFLLQDYRSLVFQGERTIWQATLCGSRATGSFSFPRDGGVHTVSSILIQFSSTDRASGNTTWSWTNGTESCEGTSTFTMAR